ncbi:MAG TPA: alpha-amylase family glycosyl hydrolase [Kofleriaceae bacterium]|nr:alpha-amylase family glycosyl hydrolase [Kofleriaceae bacterium]
MRRVLLLACVGLAGCDSSSSSVKPESRPAPDRPAAAPATPAATPAGPAATPAPAAPPVDDAPWWKGAVFYQVFVRSFQDSGADGIGDLRGLVQRLDYLNDGDPKTTTDLGIDAIWLMPVFESPSYHGYDVVDYDAIEKDYGTAEDFQRFLDEAHRRGIRVIVDLVLNHTSEAHPWFLDSASSPGSAKRSWYVWSDKKLDWGQPWNASGPVWHEKNGAYYYGIFWSGMPDLNYRNAEVRAEAKRIAGLWLGRGVDGFRLDAIRHLIEDGPGPGQSGSPETHVFLKEFAAEVKRARPDAVLVGEVWSTVYDMAAYYGATGRDELQLLFDFPLAEAMIGAVKGGKAGDLESALNLAQSAYPPAAVDAPFLANHDQIRTATQLERDPARLKLAAALLLTMPGTPFVYYGEELGLENGPGKEDEWKRTPMPWDRSARHGFTKGKPWWKFAPGVARTSVAAEAADRGSLLSRYRSLIAARAASPALRRGRFQIVSAPDGQGAVLAFVREAEGETVLVAHNLSDAPADTGPMTVASAASAAGAEPVFADRAARLVKDGPGWRATLPPRGSGIWRLK